MGAIAFQSPRGDFGFLKILHTITQLLNVGCVSIPSRGFWFFEATFTLFSVCFRKSQVSIPSRGFWFFEVQNKEVDMSRIHLYVSIPSLGFWFFEDWSGRPPYPLRGRRKFQSPRGDFGFLNGIQSASREYTSTVSIPSRGFWFFEE